jgi:glucokinase
LTTMLTLAHKLLLEGVTSEADQSTMSAGLLQGVGVSFGGPVETDHRTVRRSMHVPGWDGFALADRLESEFGVAAKVANDADAAAMAEYRFGAGRGMEHMLYLTVSTGIGGGVIIDGQLYRGKRGWAGEIGHMPLQPGGLLCSCGRHGCLEALASGPAIARAACQALMDVDADAASLLRAFPPEQLTAREVADAARQGDPLARRVWETAMTWLGIGIAAAVNLLNPGRVVIGGGLTRAEGLLFEPVQRVVAQYALDPDVAIVPAALRDDVGVIGGTALLGNA